MKTFFKIIILIFWVGQSCNRQELAPVATSVDTDLSVSNVKAAYDNEMSIVNESFRKGKSKKEKTIKKRIDWDGSYFRTLGTKRRLVIPFHLEEEIYVKLADSSKVSYSKASLIVASTHKGKVNFEVVSLLPDTEFLQQKDRKFSGNIIVENLAGDFIAGYSKSKSSRKAITQNKGNMRTTNYCTYFDWYTCASVGGQMIGCYYDYTETYCDEVDDEDQGSFSILAGQGSDGFWREDLDSSIPDYPPTTNNSDPGIEYQMTTNGDRIDIQKYFNCFDKLPSHNATYKVRLCADLVNNENPDELTKLLKPGHAFLTMTKTNDGTSVSQSFGFYPEIGKVSSFHQPVASQIEDNGATQHEYNAYIEFEVPNEASFNVMKNMAKSLGNSMQYDLNDFNCTDFALQVINAGISESEQIRVPDWIGPSTGINYGTTPNGLYKTIAGMKAQGKQNVGVGNWHAPTGNGSCH